MNLEARNNLLASIDEAVNLMDWAKAETASIELIDMFGRWMLKMDFHTILAKLERVYTQYSDGKWPELEMYMELILEKIITDKDWSQKANGELRNIQHIIFEAGILRMFYDTPPALEKINFKESSLSEAVEDFNDNLQMTIESLRTYAPSKVGMWIMTIVSSLFLK